MESASIHPMWVIEENARRGRSCVCARPLMAPISVLITLISMIGRAVVEGRSSLNKRRRGVSFCQVMRVVAAGQLRDAIVEGNHWYMGAIPALVIRAMSKNIGLNLVQGVSQVVGPKRKRTEPVAWARKYLHAALVLLDVILVGWYEIRGMNERRFISIPNQAINQLGAVREVSVPRIRVEIKRSDEMGMYKGGEIPIVGA